MLNEQLVKWRNGESIHDVEHNMCCPDFSCCQPQLLANKETREAFCRAEEIGDEETKIQILMTFLAAAVSDYNIYIAGDTETKES